MKRNDLSKELELAKLAAFKIGELQLQHFKGNLAIIRKSRKDLVSNVDIECQKLCTKLLKSSFDYDILSEEKRINVLPKTDYFWIVDPIDGTHNYISGLPLFGVSIALASRDEFLLGVIFIPFFNELYSAVRDDGAFLNDNRIYVSNNKDMEKSMINYDNQLHNNKEFLDRYGTIVDNSFTTRITGSAVFDLVSVASGLIDARIFNNTKIFDFAAGVVISSEAGGKNTDLSGKKVTINSTSIVSSNGHIHDRLLELLNQ